LGTIAICYDASVVSGIEQARAALGTVGVFDTLDAVGLFHLETVRYSGSWPGRAWDRYKQEHWPRADYPRFEQEKIGLYQRYGLTWPPDEDNAGVRVRLVVGG